MRPGDRDAELHAHELGQHLGARDDGNLQLARPRHLGVRERDGRRDDEDVDGFGDVLTRVRADLELRTEPREATRRLALDEVGAGDRVAEGEQHLCDAAHPDAADAHEVDTAPASVHRGIPLAGQPEPSAPLANPTPEPDHAPTELQKARPLFK